MTQNITIHLCPAAQRLTMSLIQQLPNPPIEFLKQYTRLSNIAKMLINYIKQAEQAERQRLIGCKLHSSLEQKSCTYRRNIAVSNPSLFELRLTT